MVPAQLEEATWRIHPKSLSLLYPKPQTEPTTSSRSESRLHLEPHGGEGKVGGMQWKLGFFSFPWLTLDKPLHGAGSLGKFAWSPSLWLNSELVLFQNYCCCPFSRAVNNSWLWKTCLGDTLTVARRGAESGFCVQNWELWAESQPLDTDLLKAAHGGNHSPERDPRQGSCVSHWMLWCKGSQLWASMAITLHPKELHCLGLLLLSGGSWCPLPFMRDMPALKVLKVLGEMSVASAHGSASPSQPCPLYCLFHVSQAHSQLKFSI